MLQPTPETIRQKLDEVRAGADHASAQIVADIVNVVSAGKDDEQAVGFFSSLNHDQCLALGKVLISASELVTLILMAVDKQHATVCTGKHDAELN